MAINTNQVEANLTAKLNSTTTTTDAKEFLLLGKAVEALTPSIAVQDVIDEGDTQIGRVTTEGNTQVAAVQAAGSNYATLSGATFTGDVDFGSNKITYANVYATEADLPSASTYHGMFAHVHGTGKAYYAHAGNWVELVNTDASGNVVINGSLTATSFVGVSNTQVVNDPTVTGASYMQPSVGSTFSFSATSELNTATISSFKYTLGGGSEQTVAATNGTATVSVTYTGTAGETKDLVVYAVDSLGNISDDVTFTTTLTNDITNTPSITSPTDGALGLFWTFDITADAFGYSGAAQTHASTDWQIATDSNFSNIVDESLLDTTNLTSYRFETTLTSTTFYARVRYNGSTIPSQYSPTISFSTMANFNGEQSYTTPGTYTFTVPTGVTEVCAVVVGGGAYGCDDHDSSGGGGGGLGWKNSISVNPGSTHTVVVGAGGTSNGQNGTQSYFSNSSLLSAGGGVAGVNLATTANRAGGTFVGDGGGNGGTNVGPSQNGRSGGASAGGYSGNAPDCPSYNFPANQPTAGSGAGGHGSCFNNGSGGGGGGTGLFGRGPEGISYGTGDNDPIAAGQGYTAIGRSGTGGSSGQDGLSQQVSAQYWRGNGGYYGGAGGGSSNTTGNYGGVGAKGGVRIIWGPNRSFPTNAT